MDRIRVGFVVVLLTLLSSQLAGQILRYDVVKGSKNLGQMTIHRSFNGNEMEIQIESEVTYRVLLAFTVRYNLYEKFVNEKLNWGKALSTLNGNTQKDSKIVQKNKVHELTINGITATVSQPISYSISQIYFDEPFDGQEVFSQQFGRFLTFKKVAEHKYVLTSPDGDNYYTYLNGICINVRVLRDFANFDFVMQPETLVAVKAKADSLYIDVN